MIGLEKWLRAIKFCIKDVDNDVNLEGERSQINRKLSLICKYIKPLYFQF